MGKLLQIINSWNAKFSGYFLNKEAIIYRCSFNLHDCTFNFLPKLRPGALATRLLI